MFVGLNLGAISSYAPDVTKAHVSASQILTLLRRKPSIDSYSQDGLKLVRRVIQLKGGLS